jgi:excisionase family DNA binding protein
VPRAESYTVAEVAERYAVTVGTVLAWVKGGELRGINVSRSARSKKPRYRVSAEALAAFESARTPTPPAPATRRRRRDGYVPQFYT